MYQGKHGNTGRAPRRPRSKRTLLAALALVLVLGLAIGGTVAYLFTNTDSITNTFTPAKVTTTVEENFENNVKNNVAIKNTGEIDAYIRAMVVVTWQNDKGEVYATAPVENTDYTVTWTKHGWFEKDGYYYHASKVASNASTGKLLTDCKPVEGKAPEGYHLVVEILAEAIQAEPVAAVQEAWDVKISDTDGTIMNESGWPVI